MRRNKRPIIHGRVKPHPEMQKLMHMLRATGKIYNGEPQRPPIDKRDKDEAFTWMLQLAGWALLAVMVATIGYVYWQT